MPPPPLFDRAFIDDPHPAYDWLREHAPVHKTRLPNGVEAYLVTRYDDVKAVLADPRLSKNAAQSFPGWRPGRTGIPGEHRSGVAAHLLNLDPPDHTRLRRLVAKAFTPRRIADFEPRIIQTADTLIDAFTPGGDDSAFPGAVDLIRTYAFPLPIIVICDMLGVPPEGRALFHEWATGMIERSGPRGGVARSVKQIRGYLKQLIHAKRGDLADDLLSALIRASDHGEHLTEDEAAAMAFILLFAGFETTVNLIGNGCWPCSAIRRSSTRCGPTRTTPTCDRGRGTAPVRRPGRVRHLALHHRAGPTVGARPSRPANRSWPCWPPPTATRPGSPTRTRWTSAARPAGTWPSATASTSASAPRWPGSRAGSPSSGCSPATGGCASPRRRRPCAGTPA